MKKTTLSILFMCICAPALAENVDEPFASPQIWEQEGFTAVEAPLSAPNVSLPPMHSLEWPVHFQDRSHSLGNSMAEFQPYGTPYWHGGCDLRVAAGAEVHAPIAGRIEGGHYGYSNNPDGSMTKFWLPWPKPGNDTYFEIAVVADDGTRYEFHHVNRQTLPAPIVSALNAGGGHVELGTLLGYAIRWSDGVYHHIHYNVIRPDSTRINPEFISRLIPDSLKPTVKGAYAMMPKGEIKSFGSGVFSERPKEFILAVFDKKDDNEYVQPPSRVQVKFANGITAGWDFTGALQNNDGSFPALWDVYKKMLTTPTGSIVETSGGYGVGLSLVRLPVPDGATGDFVIEISDAADNVTKLTGRLTE